MLKDLVLYCSFRQALCSLGECTTIVLKVPTASFAYNFTNESKESRLQEHFSEMSANILPLGRIEMLLVNKREQEGLCIPSWAVLFIPFIVPFIFLAQSFSCYVTKAPPTAVHQ